MRNRSSNGRDVPGAAWRLGADLGVLVLALLAVGAVQHVLGRGSDPALTFIGVAEGTAALVAAASLARSGLRVLPRGAARTAQLLLAAGCACFAAGQALYTADDVLGVTTSATTGSDGPFLAFALLLVASSAVHLRGRVRSHTGVRAVLDGALLGLSLLTVVWVLWLGEAVARADDRPLALVIPLTYPVLDVVFLTVTIVSVLRGGLTVPGVLVMAAAAALACADGSYFYGVLGEHGFETGGFADFCWMTAFGLFAVAARYRRTTRDSPRPPAPGSVGWLVPYFALLPATTAGAVRLWTATDRFVLVTVLAMVVLAMARQFLALDDHRRLLAVAEDQRAQLDHLAHVDPLTGLENRRRFSERLGDAVRASLVTGSPVVVAFVDLDGFKAVNDTSGHAAGDELLRQVAGRLRGAVREADCAARWGGDEFAVLVTDPHVEAAEVVERLRAAVARPFPLGEGPLRASASIGAVREDPRELLAALPGGGDADPVPDLVEALLAAADARMYQVKRARRGPVPAPR
ncbi:diguanylate cyclase [Kineococcus radiotolerans SRS30216 = ATCC BAA-149]|uniref:Diguanylate cyclase n=1 Tax=Kineococcus radiotolerans (strain ATCC BAA-149 / DSM 14245 / SRS30216) TaxID=266940 RepID=A6W4T7_KINRD|nr:diguanylate cyclase [Kineococcus radiotolerans SRS30216 = ATCC BAA-149]